MRLTSFTDYCLRVLSGVLAEAVSAFYVVLDGRTLADLAGSGEPQRRLRVLLDMAANRRTRNRPSVS